jgi:hypothetical protein
MKTPIVKAVVALFAPLLISPPLAAGLGTVFICAGPEGSVVLSNVPTGMKCEPVATSSQDVPPPAEGKAGSRAAEPVAAAASAAAHDGPPPLETRLERYRETMLRGASKDPDAPVPALNPAVSRRYLMTNRSAYQATN